MTDMPASNTYDTPSEQMKEVYGRLLLPFLPEAKDAQILDLGCGTGVVLGVLKSMGYTRVKGFDVRPQAVEFCRKLGLDADCADIRSLEIPGECRLIILMDVIEHLTYEEAQRLAARLEGKSERVLLKTPNMSSIQGRNAFYSDPSHLHGYNENSLHTLLSAGGTSTSLISVMACQETASALGLLREKASALLHRAAYSLEQPHCRPGIFTKNLLAVMSASK